MVLFGLSVAAEDQLIRHIPPERRQRRDVAGELGNNGRDQQHRHARDRGYDVAARQG